MANKSPYTNKPMLKFSLLLLALHRYYRSERNESGQLKRESTNASISTFERTDAVPISFLCYNIARTIANTNTWPILFESRI